MKRECPVTDVFPHIPDQPREGQTSRRRPKFPGLSQVPWSPAFLNPINMSNPVKSLVALKMRAVIIVTLDMVL